MEPRVIIVIAALALFVVILIGFLIAVVRSVRKHEEEVEPEQTLGEWPALPQVIGLSGPRGPPQPRSPHPTLRQPESQPARTAAQLLPRPGRSAPAWT